MSHPGACASCPHGLKWHQASPDFRPGYCRAPGCPCLHYEPDRAGPGATFRKATHQGRAANGSLDIGSVR